MYWLLVVVLLVLGIVVVRLTPRVQLLKSHAELPRFLLTVIATFIGVFGALQFDKMETTRAIRNDLVKTLTISMDNLELVKGSVDNIPKLFEELPKHLPDSTVAPKSLAEFLRQNPLSAPAFLRELLALDKIAGALSPETLTQILAYQESVDLSCQSLNELANKGYADEAIHKSLDTYVRVLYTFGQVLFAEIQFQSGRLSHDELNQLHLEMATLLSKAGPAVIIERDPRALLLHGSSYDTTR